MNNLRDFKLETYLAQHEFSAPYLLCCSDAETVSMQDVIALATPEEASLWNNLHLGYTEAQGSPKLRASIRRAMYQELSSDDNILVFAGAEDAIFCALFALARAQDHVIVLTPCYQSLAEIPKLKNADVSFVGLREENKWRIDIDDIKRVIKPNTTMLVMNFPHNPTGQIISQDEMDELVALCRKHDLWLFSDEVYRLLGAPSLPWVKPAALCYEKALSLGVMSKSFGMAGLRIGWIACQDQMLLRSIEKVKHYTSICSSGPSEILSIIALNHHEHFLGRNNAIVNANITMLDEFFCAHHDRFTWIRPEGGCVGFVRLLGLQNVDDFCNKLLRDKGVLLLPASVYEETTNHFRIGFGRKNMPEALREMEKFLR